jgi:hypothetical protein
MLSIGEPNWINMNASTAILGLTISASALVGCARQPAVSSSPTVAGPANTPYQTWTTAQLQQRRNDLYYMLPQRQNAGPSPQQEEIRAIEGELMRRFRAGDKAAELKPAWPAPSPHGN